jgi:hypothetical protein
VGGALPGLGGNHPMAIKKKTKGQPIGAQFVPLLYSLFEDDIFASLPGTSYKVLSFMMYVYKKQKGNGGVVSFGCREAETRCRIDHTTAWRALQRLQKDGFITEIHKGHMVPIVGRQHVATTWRLNVKPFH